MKAFKDTPNDELAEMVPAEHDTPENVLTKAFTQHGDNLGVEYARHAITALTDAGYTITAGSVAAASSEPLVDPSGPADGPDSSPDRGRSTSGDRPTGADDLDDDEPSMTEKIASLKRIADQLEAGKLALADPHADDPVCPTCGGTKKLLSGDVFMCTDVWHLYRCHCGRRAVTTIAGRPWCGDDR